MAWYRCEAQGELSLAAGPRFAATRFVEAEAAEAAASHVRRIVGRELVRRGADPLKAESLVSVAIIARIDEDEVPGIVAPDMVWTG